jgi:hypothetical protein
MIYMPRFHFLRVMQNKWRACLLIALTFTGSAWAQKTKRIEIHLEPCVKKPAKIVFVSNDGQQKLLDTNAGQVWVTSLLTEFVIQDACASLRLGGARTNCQRAAPADDPENRYAPLALFTFKCDEQDAWPVVVQIDPKIAVSYVRRLESTNALPNPDKDCACKEKDSFRDGKRTLEDVRFPVERLLLQLSVVPPNDQGLGLSINAITLHKQPSKDQYSFNRDGLAGLLSLQRVKGEKSPPSLSSTAIDIDMAKLNKMGVTKLTVTVN